jgi:tetratricopeptide (TPR) repeat protein
VLRTGLAEAFAGRGRLMMLVGEPGIGKTRLAEELALSARAEGATVHWGWCWEGEGAPAFWPWIQVIRAQIEASDPAKLQTQSSSGAADIAQLVSEAPGRLPDLPPLPSLGPDHARFRLFDSIATFFRNAATGEQPLIMILEDLHWADTPSLRLLQFLAREIGSAHVLIIGTYRDVEVLDRGHPLAEALGELSRHQVFHRITLGGLTEKNVSRYIALTIGKEPPGPLATWVYRETEGNPFFVGEMVRLLAPDGQLADPPEEPRFSIPQGVRDVVNHRLRRFSEDCNRLLMIGAVIGQEFSLNILERLSKLSHTQLLDELGPAVAAQIIAEVPQAVGRYRFGHALIRDTLYSELSPAARLRLHRQVAEALEALYGANPGSHCAELAYHFLQAAPGGDVEKAIDYATRAGERATALLAYEDAALHYERALQALEFWKPADETRQCELLLALGEAQLRAGADAARKETFLRVADLAKKLGAPEWLARATLGLVIRRMDFDDELLGLLEDALGAMEEGDSVLRARLLAALSVALVWSDQKRRQASLSQDAVEMARRVGDQATLAFALNTRLIVLPGPDDIEHRLTSGTELLQISEQSGNRERALMSRTWIISDSLAMGDMPTVNREIETLGRQAQELRQPYFLWRHATYRAMQAGLGGRFGDYERLAREALSLGERTAGEAVHVFAGQMYTLCWLRGKLKELLPFAEASVEQGFAPLQPIHRSVLAVMYSEEGRGAEARALLDELARDDFGVLSRNRDTWLIGLSELSQSCALLRYVSYAARLYQLMKPYAGRIIAAGFGAICGGSTSHFLGLLAATMKRWDEATQHFEDALEVHAKLESPARVAHTQHEYASMLLTRDYPGDREKALGLLGQALGTAERLGMEGLVEKVLALKGEAGEVRTSDMRTSAEGGAVAAAALGRVAHPQAVPGRRLVKGGNVVAFPAGAARRASDDQEAESITGGPARSGVTDSPSGAADIRPSGQTGLFRREGEYWTIAYAGTTCRLKDTMGLHYLAQLLRQPDTAFLASDLVAVAHGRHISPASAEGTRLDDMPCAAGLGDAGEILDEQAKTTYKRRLEDLQQELEEARGFNDVGRAERVETEIEFLTRELAAALGLGGRSRRAASHVERARQNVTRRVKAAIRRITENNAFLGRHLTTTIKTGTFCSYTPDPSNPVSWEF